MNIIVLNARVIHSSLNARGGSERLSIATIVAIHELGFKVTLETAERPDFLKLQDSSGVDLSELIARESTLRLVASCLPSHPADLYINTHGDVLPYFKQGMSRENSITYCHFPLAGHLIASKDLEYDRFLNNNFMASFNPKKVRYRPELAREYRQMLESTRVITNSQYSRNAIFRWFNVDATVIAPPVDVQAFRGHESAYCPRKNMVLVVSRFHPSKRLENAIRIAALMKRKKIADGMIIVGSLSPSGLGYYDFIKSLVLRYGLDDYVKIICNVEFARLVSLMNSIKVYLHPLPGEPFGIATVEAMSAGMIPVVHKVGGHAEFVPPRYWFSDFGSALDSITNALDAPDSERSDLRAVAAKFSIANFLARIKEVLRVMYDLNVVAPVKLSRVVKSLLPTGLMPAPTIESLT